MLRVYCDSNIYRILLPSHPSYKRELSDTFKDLQDNLLFCFSDAHLDDLKESKKEYSDRDLLFMGSYVKDNYFSYNHIGEKGFRCYLATPTEAFLGKDYEASKSILANPFDIDHIFKDVDDIPEMGIIKDLMKSFMNMPLFELAHKIDSSNIDERSLKMMQNIMPNYSQAMSLGDLMKNITPYSVGLLHDDKKVTELRKYIGEYLQRDNFSFDKWGLEFNEKFKDSGVGKTFLEVIENMLTDSQKNEFYLRFTYTYSMLEMFNITQERKSGGGLKKFDYESLNTDALHAYFASYCDYLVTDDKGVQVKANIVYQLYNIKTKVLSSSDLINMRQLLLAQEETLSRFINSFRHDVKNGLLLREKVDIGNGDKIQTIKTDHVYFNYFNRLQILNDGKEFAFYCERNGPGNFYMYREAEVIIRKLIDAFGVDSENKGYFYFDGKSILNDEVLERKWIFNGIAISLETSTKKDWGTFICLSIR